MDRRLIGARAQRGLAQKSWIVPILILAGAVLAYLLLAARLGNAPLQDLPNHLARAHIMADLIFDHGKVYGQTYFFHATFAPYLLGDLILVGLDHLFGTVVTACIWIGILFITMPCSMLFVARAHGLSPSASVAAALLSLYIATDWFFCLGFMNFQLAIPFAMLAYGCFTRVTRAHSTGAFLGFLVCTLLAYFMHLSGVVFIIAMVGTAILLAVHRKEISYLRGAALLAGPVLLLTGHLAFSYLTPVHLTPAEGENLSSSWGTVFYKLRGLSATFRFGAVRETGLMLLLLAAVCYPIRSRAVLRRRELEFALIGVALLGVYLALPLQSGGRFFLDVRAVPYALLFFILLGVACGDLTIGNARRQLYFCLLVAVVNLGLLATFLLPANAVLQRYKEIAATIPRGSTVLPIDTRPAQGRYDFRQHAGSYAVTESGAIVPALFAADQQQPQSYFRYRHRPYSPTVYWYTKTNGTLDWSRVRQEYRYLLVTLPYDPHRILLPFSVIRQNDVVALLDLQSSP